VAAMKKVATPAAAVVVVAQEEVVAAVVTIVPRPVRLSARRPLSNNAQPSARLRHRRTMTSVKARSPTAWKTTTFRFENCRR
jgi:hypothetical protein